MGIEVLDPQTNALLQSMTLGTPVYSTLHAKGIVPALIAVGVDAGPWSDRIWDAGGERALRLAYEQEAVKLADALCAHLPQGLLDHLLAELMRRKASLACESRMPRLAFEPAC